MADYIYLLQTKLNAAQRSALESVRESAKARGMTVFLVGGAVRDLTSGAPIRDLDVVVQGSVLSLRKELTSFSKIVGESKQTEALYLSFPGGIRMELGPALSVQYPKPGKPVFEHASILDDLRRRDFTANAMAISLNEGSYGLLMDPLNGVADIENMELRLVSNYGFIEDPVRMIRAARFVARLGWHLEEKTQQRYETGKEEGYISAMSAFQRGYETEEIFHEEDPVGVLRHLETEGWSKFLFPAWTAAKINENELNRLRDVVGQLDLAGIQADPSAAYFPILTAKLASKELQALRDSFVRPGFLEQVDNLDTETKAFAIQFTSKAAAAPSDAWKMLRATSPEQVLWLAYSSKSAPVQTKFKAFLTEWPQANNRIPYQLMQEMRITPDLPGYQELLEQLFYAIMDGKLNTPEAARAFLEPYSPPAPPPPVNLRRRAVKRESKPAKSRKKDRLETLADALPAEGDEVTSAASAEVSTAEPQKASIPAEEVTAQPAEKKKKAVPVSVVQAKKVASKPSVKSAARTAGKVSDLNRKASKQTAAPARPRKSQPKATKPAAKKSVPVKKATVVKKAVKTATAVKKVGKKAVAVTKSAAKKTTAKPRPVAKKAKGKRR